MNDVKTLIPNLFKQIIKIFGVSVEEADCPGEKFNKIKYSNTKFEE
jgi:hypothetical protein